MYNVTGHGVQTFYFGFTPKGGEWGVTFNGNFMVENEGWRASPNGTMTITEATGNVSIIYYVVPDELGGSGSTANQTFYQKHSVLITMSVVVAIAFVLVIANRVRNKDDKSANTVNGQKFFPANHFLMNRRTPRQHITIAPRKIVRKVDKNDLD